MNVSIYRTETSREALAGFMDEVLTQIPYPYQIRFVDTRMGKTHVMTVGADDKPPLVMLHGAASNLLAFGGDAPKYAGDYRVILPDIPGEAGKSAPVRLSWHNEDYLDWLDDMLDALQIKETAIVGMSFGGWIALKYAAHRDRVQKLVLTAPGGIVPARSSALVRSVVYSMQGQKGAEKMKRMVLGKGAIPEVVSRFFDAVQAHYVPRFGSPPLLNDQEIKAVRAPLMVVCAEKDVFFPAAQAQKRISRLQPGAEMVILPRAQHGMMEMDRRVGIFLRGES